MKSVLAKIFSGMCDDEVHSEFIRFGKGVYENKYLIEARKQKNTWTIKTGAEFTNFLVGVCLEETAENVAVKGVIISTLDVHTEAQKLFQVENVKKYMGIKQIVINTDVKPADILTLMQKFPRAFFALSFSTPTSMLRVKPKAPKSGKPAANGGKEVAANSCSLKTSNEALVKELLFDVPDASEAKIKHTLTINEIILPEGISDPVQMREQAKRKGVITRIAIVDGKENRKEAAFEA